MSTIFSLNGSYTLTGSGTGGSGVGVTVPIGRAWVGTATLSSGTLSVSGGGGGLAFQIGNGGAGALDSWFFVAFSGATVNQISGGGGYSIAYAEFSTPNINTV